MIPGPLRWSWCWPPWRHDSFAFSRGFLWKNWFCFGFLFRVMYSVDTFLQRAILLSFVNWFLLVTYWGGGFSLGRPGRACLKDVAPGRLGGSYYITVLYGKPITNGDSIRTLIAFLNNFSHTNKNNNMADKVGCPEWGGGLTLFCRYGKQQQQQINSAWLAQNNLD